MTTPQVKRFTGKTSRDALALVKQALGEDAIVLSTRPGAEGVEVLAMAPEGMGQIEILTLARQELDVHHPHSGGGRAARKREDTIEEANGQEYQWQDEQPDADRQNNDHRRDERDQDGVDDPGEATFQRDTLIEFGVCHRIGQAMVRGQGIHGGLFAHNWL